MVLSAERGRVSAKDRLTFVSAVNNRKLFEENFLSSPTLERLGDHEILVQEGFTSAARAYNDAIERSTNDLIIFCHQDILLPKPWIGQLEQALQCLEAEDPNWGVLGTYGNTSDGHGWGHVYSSGLGVIGEAPPRPVAVQTLDEIVLILRRSSGLRFDDSLPHFHFYGTDICLRAAKSGMRSYAIPAFCFHNTCQTLVLPKEFYECCRHVREVWKSYLPIQTSCIRITKFNLPVYARQIRECYLRHIRRKEYGGSRVQDPLVILGSLESKL